MPLKQLERSLETSGKYKASLKCQCSNMKQLSPNRIKKSVDFKNKTGIYSEM